MADPSNLRIMKYFGRDTRKVSHTLYSEVLEINSDEMTLPEMTGSSYLRNFSVLPDGKWGFWEVHLGRAQARDIFRCAICICAQTTATEKSDYPGDRCTIDIMSVVVVICYDSGCH